VTRTGACALRLIACVAVTSSAELAAQQRNQECAAELVKTGRPAAEAQEASCEQLAQELVTDAREPMVLQAMLRRVPARDFQSRATGNTGTSGSPSQGEAVPSVQPLALAGGSLAAVGSEAGTDAIAAFTINPSIFFGSLDPARAAALSRLLDLTVLAPINELDRDEDGKIDYYGIRARINVTGPRAGQRLINAVQSFARQTQQASDIADTLQAVLQKAPDFAKCVADLRAGSVGDDAMGKDCGRTVDLTPDPKTLERLREALQLARDSADSRYFGLDLRLDQGDPTLGATPGAAGTALFAGLAYGRTMVGTRSNQPSFGIKGRLGVQHVSLDDAAVAEGDRTNTAIDGAFALDFTYPYEFQPLKLAAGVEFRRGSPPAPGAEKEFRTNFVQARLSLDVPITSANSISITFAGPLDGKERPTLSINGNWQLLLPGRAPLGPTAAP
jgi:hypothetical protein